SNPLRAKDFFHFATLFSFPDGRMSWKVRAAFAVCGSSCQFLALPGPAAGPYLGKSSFLALWTFFSNPNSISIELRSSPEFAAAPTLSDPWHLGRGDRLSGTLHCDELIVDRYGPTTAPLLWTSGGEAAPMCPAAQFSMHREGARRTPW